MNGVKRTLSITAATACLLVAACQSPDKNQTGNSLSNAGQTNQEAKPGAGKTFKNSVTGLFSPSQATVKIPFEGTEAEVLVKLSQFPANQHAMDGIAALQTSQWNDAEKAFQAALQDKPANWSYHFALAVTEERQGHYAEAKKHYLDANRLKGGSEGYFDAQAGLKRLEALGQ